MPINTTAAMEPDSPPIMACFCELWLLSRPSVAVEADALLCVFSEGGPERVSDGALLVTSVGIGTASVREGGFKGRDVDTDVVLDFVSSPADEAGAYVGVRSVVKRTVTKVVERLVFSTVTVEMGITSLSVVISPFDDIVLVGVDCADVDTSSNLAAVVVSGVKIAPKSEVTCAQMEDRGIARRSSSAPPNGSLCLPAVIVAGHDQPRICFASFPRSLARFVTTALQMTDHFVSKQQR